MIIAVDFDGTIVKHKFPEIGEPLPDALRVLRRLLDEGNWLILNTCREDLPERKYLTEAVEFCKGHGITFLSHNENHHKEVLTKDQDVWSRKVLAHVYIDDRNLGGFPGWKIVEEQLLEAG